MDKDRKIAVGSSSLVALKAELHRKQQESRLVGPSSVGDGPRRVRKLASAPASNAGVEERDQRDRQDEPKDVQSLERSQAVLEAKAKLYDQLQKQSLEQGDETDNERFLVNFQQKAVDNIRGQRSQQAYDDTGGQADDPEAYISRRSDDDWVEYTDSLGRSRTVMRKDLAEYQKRDRENSRLPQSEDGGGESSAGDTLHHQRQLWQQQELNNEGERDIHYQNVLFDEARTHGAGYFAFSEDASERAQQRAELDELRERTQQQQNRATETRKRSRQNLKERLRKVRERKRLKLGLPIEDALEKPVSEDEKDEEEVAPPVDPAVEEQREEEAKKQAERERMVREWDRGKEGVRERPVLSQQQWVERQRQQRQSEFAPPTAYAAGNRTGGNGPKAASRSRPSHVPGGGGSGAEIPPPAEYGSGSGGATGSGGPGTSASYNYGAGRGAARHGPRVNEQHAHADQGSESAVPAMSFTVPPPGYHTPPPSLAFVNRPPPVHPEFNDPPQQANHAVHAVPTGTGLRSSQARHSSLYGASFKRRATLDHAGDAADVSDDAAPRGVGTEVAPPASAEYYGGGPRPSRPRGRGVPSVKDMGSAIDAGLAMNCEDQKVKEDKTFEL